MKIDDLTHSQPDDQTRELLKSYPFIKLAIESAPFGCLKHQYLTETNE